MFLVSFASQNEMPADVQEKIYSELYYNLECAYGKEEAGQRMGVLLCMLQDLDVSFLDGVL
jgi:hypothetical protein